MANIRTRKSRHEIREDVRVAVRRATGRDGGAPEIQADLAFMFFTLAHRAFLVRSRGGTDDAGYSWPDLSPRYKAYVRSRLVGRRKRRKNAKRTKPTLLQEWGRFRFPILQVTGEIETSLRPGTLLDGIYSPSKGQIYEPGPGTLRLGSAASTAAFHHGRRRKSRVPQRLLWPEPLPQDWLDEMTQFAAAGLSDTIVEAIRV